MGWITEPVLPKGDDIHGWAKVHLGGPIVNTDEELAAAFRVAARFDPSGEVAEMLGLN